MASKIKRLNRESDPPAGVLASPVPQYYDQDTEDVEDVEGLKGAPFSMLVGPDGNPISPATAGGQTAIAQAVASLESTLGTEVTLQLVKGVLDAISGKVATETTAAGILSKLADLATESTLGDVKTAVEALSGTVSDGAQKVQLTGSMVDLRGLADDRPDAGDVDPGTTYWSADTGDVSVSDGSTWRSVGVA